MGRQACARQRLQHGQSVQEGLARGRGEPRQSGAATPSPRGGAVQASSRTKLKLMKALMAAPVNWFTYTPRDSPG